MTAEHYVFGRDPTLLIGGEHMRMPGFTAEASVFPGEAAASARYFATERETVVLQLLAWPKRFPGLRCNPSCVCIHSENCPCCIGPGPGGEFMFAGL